MTRWLWLVVGLVTACGAPASHFAGLTAGPRAASFRDHIVASKLPNGLTLAMLPDARTNLVTVTVRYEVGAADDPSAYLGLAHYVEHLLYLASEEGRGDAVLDGNAVTSLDTTYFYQTALDSQLDSLVETAARRFEVACRDLPATELARERDVVIEEVKQRSRGRWNIDGVAAALWGADHPYAHSPGGTSFSTISRDALCSFVDEHYAPGAATVVITGDIDAAAIARIRDRFGKIPARALASRPQLRPYDYSDVRVNVPGLERATVILAFRAPGQVGRSAAAIHLLDGMYWRGPGLILRTSVIGGERARLVIAYAEVDDPTRVDVVAGRMRDLFADATVGNLASAKQRARTEIVQTFDDLGTAGITIADLAARNAPLTRYRALSEIDDVKDADLAHWIAGAPARVVVMLPDSNTDNLHSIAELHTELHHVEVLRRDAVADATPPAIAARPEAPIVADTLANGLHVVYSRDPQAIGIDARVVMPFDPGSGRDLVVAIEAANELMPAALDGEDAQTLRWYATVGVPVAASVTLDSTTLGVSGFSLFGDWHVWNLARSVVSGTYPEVLDVMVGKHAFPSSVEPPDATQVAAIRLGLMPPLDDITQLPRATLEQFRASHYDPRHATLIVAGNFDLAAMRKEVTELFGPWRAGGSAPTAAAVPALHPGFVAIPVLHANTLELRIAFARSSRPHTDDAARAVLQQMINDRLRVVRDSLGASYGISASIRGQLIIAGGSIEPAYAADGARAIRDALTSIKNADATFAADFAAARKHVLSKALAQPLGASARASQLQRAVEAGRAPSDLDAEIDAIRTLDLTAVRDLAARELDPSRMVTVVRGEPEAVKAALAAFGATSFDTVTH